MSEFAPLSRRRFLKRTFAFSAASMMSGCGWGIRSDAAPDPVDGGVSHVLMVGDWGQYGSNGSFGDQAAVAKAMSAYAAKYKLSTDALLMLGDNFYGPLNGGIASNRWQTQFESMYPAADFPGPVYAVPGNHDYERSPESKLDAEVAYSLRGQSRWTMPAYSKFTFPATDPTVTFIALDSNMPNEPAQPYPPANSGFYTLSDARRQEQLAWLTATLKEPLTTPFLVVFAHHPLYSNGAHGDNQTLIRDWDPLLREHNVHLYLAGHDHDMQHLELSNHPTSFFLSGGGGAELIDLKGSSHGPYAAKLHGFSHLQVRPDIMILRHLDTSGNLLHKFTKTPDGVVKILK